MDLRQQLIEYRAQLADSSSYPRAPAWTKELLLKNLDALLNAGGADDLEERLSSFHRGAARAIYDQCSRYEVDELMNNIPGP
ncbi:MAG: hypothetical protein ACI93T_002566 [Porticoccaceae bacterium]|jgi:hypothetical protein